MMSAEMDRSYLADGDTPVKAGYHAKQAELYLRDAEMEYTDRARGLAHVHATLALYWQREAEVVRERSLVWEARTEAENIPTIERFCYQTEGGANLCIWPECTFATRDVAALWRHVHSAHGDSLPQPALTEREPDHE